jgi:hypothetical protein
MVHGCVGVFPGKKGCVQVLAGLAPSGQTIRSLLINPRLPKLVEKNQKFGKFTLMEKWTQLLLIEYIWQSKKFDKPSNNPLVGESSEPKECLT